jgi:hypothetical protein
MKLWVEINTKDSHHRKSIRLYAGEIDHWNNILVTKTGVEILDESKRLHSFHWFEKDMIKELPVEQQA